MNPTIEMASWTIDALLAQAMAQPDPVQSGRPTMAPVSRLEALLADVFEKGLASMERQAPTLQ